MYGLVPLGGAHLVGKGVARGWVAVRRLTELVGDRQAVVARIAAHVAARVMHAAGVVLLGANLGGTPYEIVLAARVHTQVAVWAAVAEAGVGHFVAGDPRALVAGDIHRDPDPAGGEPVRVVRAHEIESVI